MFAGKRRNRRLWNGCQRYFETEPEHFSRIVIPLICGGLRQCCFSQRKDFESGNWKLRSRWASNYCISRDWNEARFQIDPKLLGELVSCGSRWAQIGGKRHLSKEIRETNSSPEKAGVALRNDSEQQANLTQFTKWTALNKLGACIETVQFTGIDEWNRCLPENRILHKKYDVRAVLLCKKPFRIQNSNLFTR